MRSSALVVAGCVLLGACAAESKSSATVAPAKRAVALGQWAPQDLAKARAQLKAEPCAEGDGWKCGIVLYSGKGDYASNAGWVAVVVRPTAGLEVIGNGWDGPMLSLEVGEALMPPGVVIRWEDGDHDNIVNRNEIQVLG